MTRRSAQSRSLASLAAKGMLIAVMAAPTAAVTFDFEPPTYSAGDLIGQNGWVKNAYFGALNGTVNVSNVAPLTGAQSVSYTQTTAGGFSDVSKSSAILVTPGVQGTDLTVSYTIKGTTNGVGGPIGGLFLGNGAAGGASPIFGRLNGGVFEVGASLGIVPVNDFFFGEGEKLKVTYEVDFDTSTMNLILENLDFGDLFSQSYPFFAPYGGPSGPNGEFVVDAGVFLRGGNVQIDDISLEAGVGPLITNFDWVGTGSGNWNQASNWNPLGVPGGVPGRQHAKFGTATGPTTVYNNSTRILNSLEINSAQSYYFSGTGILGFQADSSTPTPVAPTLKVLTGAHQIQLPVDIIDNTTVTVSAGASLDFNNVVDLNGKTLSLSGTVRLNNAVIGGGTVASAGSLVANGPSSIAATLISSGALIAEVDSAGADSFLIDGDAIVSGILDLIWAPGNVAQGPLTVLTTSGALDAAGLKLAPEDARAFALGATHNSLTITYLGAAVPEPASFAMIALGMIGLAGRRPRRRTASSPACHTTTNESEGAARRAVVRLSLVAVVLLAAQTAMAISYTFENPPYTPGVLNGQQGWDTPGYILADPFFGGQVNGTVEVSATTPLVGAQSVRYTQTIDPPTAGGTGGSDISRPNTVFAVEDGTDAADLTGSFQLKADANGLGNGQMGFFVGQGGRSPMFIQVTNASSSGSTGDIIVGHDFVVPTVGTYAAGHTYEFRFGLDLDGQAYEAFARDLTAGTPEFQLVGPGPGGRLPFFGGALGDDGDGSTYTFDTTMLLRSGTGQIDNITVVGDDYTQAQWGGGSGNWATNNSWIPRIAPNAAAGTNAPLAVFGSRITAPQTVFTDATQTVNGLQFDNANKYVVGGAGTIALKANTIGGTVTPTVTVVSGAHELQVAVSVLDNTTVTVAAGSQLDFNNNVALGGKTLTSSGAVNLNVGVTGGGAIINSGTLGTGGTTPIAANLTSSGTLLIDLGAASKDFFDIAGSATLSGTIDVVLEPGFTPTGQYTVLTASGGLNATGLSLHPSDIAGFTLMSSGNSLILKVGGILPGDFDKNGVVNAADLTKWRGDFGANGNSDGDGDGDSDGNDFLVWQRNLGRTAATPSTTATPEPCSLALAAVPFVVLATIGRSRRSVRTVV